MSRKSPYIWITVDNSMIYGIKILIMTYRQAKTKETVKTVKTCLEQHYIHKPSEPSAINIAKNKKNFLLTQTIQYISHIELFRCL